MKKLYSLIAFLLTIVGCARPEYLIFSSDRDGDSNIYKIKSDGSAIEQLTGDKSEQWSPRVMNKHEISFLAVEEGKFKRYLLPLKTKERQEIRQPQACTLDDKNTIPSPNGKWQAYVCNGDIYVSDMTFENTRNLTQNINSKDFKPCWFPDSQKLAFTSNRDGNLEIYTISIDGTGLKNISGSPHNEEAPDVSPDGRKILYSSNRDGNSNQEIYVQDLQSGELENISQSNKWELLATWSKNGKYIYYGSNQDGNWEIYVYDLKSKQAKNITNSQSFDGDPQVLK